MGRAGEKLGGGEAGEEGGNHLFYPQRGKVGTSQMEGRGRRLFVAQVEDGCLYEGEGEGDTPHGYGAETYPDGSSYEGQFNQGQRSGLGTYYFTSGRIYEGQWSENVRDGTGIERYEFVADTCGDSEAAELKKSVVVRYEHGALVMRRPLEHDKTSTDAHVDSLMMDVLDAVQLARTAARDARATPNH